MPFLPFFFYLLFLDKNKKMHCTTNLCLTVKVHKLSTEQKKKQNSNRKKKKTKCEGPTNKSTKDIQIFLEFSDIEKGLVWSDIKTKHR
jgi:hypothetical protein